MRHITPGTLFSTGMRFYQVRDSLQAGNAITLQKVNNGKRRYQPPIEFVNELRFEEKLICSVCFLNYRQN